MRELCPISTPGTPGMDTPLTCSPGADSATWYQMDGSVCGRCGSPASIDPPPATPGPFAAHALLSGCLCTVLAGGKGPPAFPGSAGMPGSRLTWASSAPAASAAPRGNPRGPHPAVPADPARRVLPPDPAERMVEAVVWPAAASRVAALPAPARAAPPAAARVAYAAWPAASGLPAPRLLVRG